MKFKKGKLYKVVKDIDPGCIGCILRYIGVDEFEEHLGKPVKLGKNCHIDKDWGDCPEFQCMIEQPNEFKLVEHIDMVDFCKKLKKKLDKQRKV